jgi:hypothetical protein
MSKYEKGFYVNSDEDKAIQIDMLQRRIDALQEDLKILLKEQTKPKMVIPESEAHMTTPIGLLPVNSYGMRQLVDALEKALKQLGGYEAQTRAIQIRNGKYNDNV